MIHFHGGPITPITAAMRVWRGRHAFISFAHPQQIEIAAECAQSFAIDNGAFSVWKAGRAMDWRAYYDFVGNWMRHPGCEFAIIPDVIDGTEQDNAALICRWPYGQFGVPVWHMHESIDWLVELCSHWQRVALGSSGEYAVVGSESWWSRMSVAMNAICNEDGMPKAKLHGLRMLNPEVFQYLPFSSADSCNVAMNIGIDGAWKGTYAPASKETRAVVIAERVEQFNSSLWTHRPIQRRLFA